MKKKKSEGERQQRRRRTLRCYKGLHNSRLGARSPSGRPARAARRRAGTSSTTSSARLSRVGLPTRRPSTAHFLRPNKASEGVFKPPGGRPWLGISSRPHLHCGVRLHPPSAQAGAPRWLCWNRPRGSLLSHQGQEETVTKCLEIHRACQESVCVVLGRTQVAFFHQELFSGFGHGKSCAVLSKALY